MSLFGKPTEDHAQEYPWLDETGWAGQRITAVEQELKQLVQKVSGPIEIVPSDHATYVFTGEPPKKLGLAWIRDGQIRGFYRLMVEHDITPTEIEKALEALRDAYTKFQYTEHYTTMIDQHKVVVTPSVYLANEVRGIIDGMLQ